MSDEERSSAARTLSMDPLRFAPIEATSSLLVTPDTSSNRSMTTSLTALVNPSSTMVCMEPDALPVTIEAMGLRFSFT